jgi:hypothetical protein
MLASPVRADPPEVFEAEIFDVFPDVHHGVVVFWNVTRADACVWGQGGFEGSPPVIELVTAHVVETGKGALVGTFHATRAIELWQLDDDADLSGRCQNTDDQSGPLLSGTATVSANDNDLDVSGTRVNAFGDRGQGTLQGTDGSRWHYSWTFRAEIDRDGEFRVVVFRSNLRQIR